MTKTKTERPSKCWTPTAFTRSGAPHSEKRCVFVSRFLSSYDDRHNNKKLGCWESRRCWECWESRRCWRFLEFWGLLASKNVFPMWHLFWVRQSLSRFDPRKPSSCLSSVFWSLSINYLGQKWPAIIPIIHPPQCSETEVHHRTPPSLFQALKTTCVVFYSFQVFSKKRKFWFCNNTTHFVGPWRTLPFLV